MSNFLNRLLPMLALAGVVAVLALALAWMMRAGAPVRSEVPVHVSADGADGAGGRLLLHSRGTTRATLAFDLPAPGNHWVLWLPRDPIRSIDVGGHDAQGKPWQAHAAGFTGPFADDGVSPAGYGIVLPRGLAGHQVLRISVLAELEGAPAPRIVPLDGALRLAARERGFSSALYAAWATLLIASLALYWAVRESLFLAHALYTLTALVFMAALQGHLYSTPGLAGLFGGMGMHGFWLAMLLFNLCGLWLVLQFVEAASSHSRWVRRMPALLPLVALPLVLLPLPAPYSTAVLEVGAGLAWGLAAPATLWAAVDGSRRRVPMAGAVAAALLLLLVAAGFHQGMNRGLVTDSMATRHGFQFALVLLSLVLFVGLSSRIGSVRQQLVDATSARRDTEERLRHEQVRARLGPALKDALRDVPEERIAAVALRVLGEHAGQLLGTGEVLVLAEDCHGHDRLFVQATTQATATARAVQSQRAMVRNHALNREPVEVRLAGGRRDAPTAEADYLVVPLRVPAPGWGALVAPLGGRRLLIEDRDALAELARVAMLHLDEAQAACQLRHTAERDALTGTLNRRTLDLLVVREFKLASSQPLSVLFIDIDWFKRVNDTHGHACGDECLRRVATALRGALRPADSMGRYGGEEFLVLLPGQDGASARVAAERLRQAVERMPVAWQDDVLQLTVSIGLATRRDGDGQPANLLARADKALYRAKHEGRNRVCAASAYVE